MSMRVRPVLLVEDNPMDVDLTCQALQELSVVNPILACRDGEEALRYMDEHQLPSDSQLPILVLLDLRLPKVDGIDVLRYARHHAVWKQVPVVVLATSRESTDIEAAYKLGVNSYVVKPVDSSAFAELMKNIKVYWLLTNEQPFGKAMPGGI
jgi:CheY-like chemotaxis protein